MPRLFFGNFDFEESLNRPAGRTRPNRIRRILAELASCWTVLIEAGDLIWCPHVIEESFVERLVAAGWPPFQFVRQAEDVPAGCRFVPWGWTAEAVEFGTSMEAVIDAPPLDVVRRVNSRVVSWELERSLGVDLDGSAVASSTTELVEAVARLLSASGRCLVKAEYSQAGRDRVVVDRDASTDRDRLVRWAERQLRAGNRLVVEPWLEAVAEAGLQFELPPQGDVSLAGVAEMILSPDGGYAGSLVKRRCRRDDKWDEAVTVGMQAAEAVAAAGYFGPLGIDAMQYRTPDGTLAIRPIQDVNVRWAMGRLSLGLRRFVPDDCDARWLHGRALDAARNDESPRSDDRRVIPTSPPFLDDRPVDHPTALVIETPAFERADNNVLHSRES